MIIYFCSLVTNKASFSVDSFQTKFHSWMKRSVIDHNDDGTDASLREVKSAIKVLSAHFIASSARDCWC